MRTDDELKAWIIMSVKAGDVSPTDVKECVENTQ